MAYYTAARLKALSEEELIDLVVAPSSDAQHVVPAQMDMQRRLLVAIRDFNTASGRQARAMFWLTVVIAVLTVALLWLTWVQTRPQLRPVGATASRPVVGSGAEGGWFIESFADGVMTATHEGSTYKATCSDSYSYNNAPGTPDADHVLPLRTCDLPIELVGRRVQPYGGQEREADGSIVVILAAANTLAIRRLKDEHTPWRMDTFTVTSVIAKH